MSLTINSYNQTGTDRQRARATEFINKSDREVTSMATRSYHISHADSDRKLNKRLKYATLSIPAAAFASGLILKNGVKSSAKYAANWGILLAAPVIVHDIAKAMAPKDKNGKKHSNMPFGIGLGLSLAGYLGGVAALNKAAANKHVNAVADTIISGTKDVFDKVKKEVKIPENVSKKFADLKSKVKLPESLQAYVNTVKNSEKFGAFTEGAAKFGKKMLKHSPDAILFSVLGVTLAAAIKQGIDISSKKSQIKNAQLDTARTLVNAYAEENNALKNA